MNHATRFYNVVKMLYKDDPELFQSMIKEFDNLIIRDIVIPLFDFNSFYFNDNSAVTTIRGECYITTSVDEFIEYMHVLFEGHRGLETKFMEVLKGK